MSTTRHRPGSPGTGRTRQTTGRTWPPRWRGAPRGLVRAGLVLADSDSEAALAAPTSCVADEAGHPSDELLDLLVPLLELIEELRSTLSGIAANDCVHHCLLETRRGDEHPIEPAARLRYARCRGSHISAPRSLRCIGKHSARRTVRQSIASAVDARQGT